MSDILKFLNDRLAEDEQWARESALADRRFDRERILREVAAKRYIIDQALCYEAKIDGEWGCGHAAHEIAQGRCDDIPVDEIGVLGAFASAYGEHPDYGAGWMPIAAEGFPS